MRRFGSGSKTSVLSKMMRAMETQDDEPTLPVAHVEQKKRGLPVMGVFTAEKNAPHEQDSETDTATGDEDSTNDGFSRRGSRDEEESAFTDPGTGLILKRGRDQPTYVLGTERKLPSDAVQRTLQIWDWDDTLFPSSWINSQGLSLLEESEANAHQQRQLNGLAKIVEQTFRAALNLGEVVIITNAEEGWVDLSCKKFFPTLYPVLTHSGVKILSARTTYEQLGVFRPFDWKLKAFEAETSGFCQSYRRGDDVFNLLSIGDSVHEREALLRAGQNINRDARRVKSIKLSERPDMGDLKRTHEVLQRSLVVVCQHDGDADLQILCDTMGLAYY